LTERISSICAIGDSDSFVGGLVAGLQGLLLKSEELGQGEPCPLLGSHTDAFNDRKEGAKRPHEHLAANDRSAAGGVH